ncbi:MAG: SDR family oxidoreductase [Proteobacteria bacterium]|nr:SDR family oxidoreductase [Pseudomonadota bacterium]
MARPIALVTGASAGIGEEIARQLAATHDLVLVARRRDRLQALADELSGTHRVEAVDLTDANSRRSLVERLSSDGTFVELLVNNAGFGSTGRFWELDADGEVLQVELNAVALTDLTRRLLPPMVERGRGQILNIASTAAFQPGPFMSTYFATKAFVLCFTEGLAFELRGTGVTATVHCPGATASEFGQVAGNDKNRLFTKGAVASSADVAADALAAMRSGKVVRVHGLANRVGAFLAPLAPRAIVLRLGAMLNQP